ncbi:MAG: nodulation protein NfeD [Candidatus Caldarchaeum sp.]
MRIATLLLIGAVLLLSGHSETPQVLLLTIDGYISTGTAMYLERVLTSSRYDAVILTINTLGGSADAMLRIVEAIERSPIPVIGFVYPVGGKALSAGTYILMSTHFAAMAPETLIGSAQPVIGGEPVTDSKVLNFFAEKMGTLAESRGRNREEAVKIVYENKNFNPASALEAGLIEAIATDVDELLALADGKTVRTITGEKILRLKNASITNEMPGVTEALVSVLSDPIVSSILLSLGILLLLVGLSTPGWGGEIVGGLMIVLGLVGQGLNINWAGVFLTILGAALLLYELLSPGFGVAGFGGLVSLTVGIILIGGFSPAPALVSPEWTGTLLITVISTSLLISAFLGFLVYKALKAQKRRPLAQEPRVGRAVDTIDAGHIGYVFVEGEYWRAKAVKPVKERDMIKVVGKENGVLLVEPFEPT